jgi:hypothetical protein
MGIHIRVVGFFRSDRKPALDAVDLFEEATRDELGLVSTNARKRRLVGKRFVLPLPK